MSNENIVHLQEYVTSQNQYMLEHYTEIEIFKLDVVANLTLAQRKLFVTHLYHARGHFDRQLFQRASLGGENDQDKLKKLEDICDELGISFIHEDGIYGLLDGKSIQLKFSKSHEDLYLDFANDIGIDLSDEIGSYFQPNYLREYNEKLIKLLVRSDRQTREVAFSAYEFLDNVDYECLYHVALSLGASRKGVGFFNVHRKSDHFEKTKEVLSGFWAEDRSKCMSIFNEIFDIQLGMWNELSKKVICHEST